MEMPSVVTRGGRTYFPIPRVDLHMVTPDGETVSAYLPDAEDISYYWEDSHIPIGSVNVLPVQPRRTFRRIEELAETIAEKGYCFPPIVAMYDRAGAESHLRYANSVWAEANLSLDRLAPSRYAGQEVFYILIAGERRIRAGRNLLETGCERCRKRYEGKVPYGACLQRHFRNPHNLIPVRIPMGATPAEAFEIQILENTTQEPVPAHEQADADYFHWRYRRMFQPDLSIADFARITGRSESAIRDILRFADLPILIQDMVREGSIQYGIATQIGRLQQQLRQPGKELGISDEELVSMAQMAKLTKATVKDIRKLVDREIEERKHGQLTMMELVLTPEEANHLRQSDHLRAAAAKASHGFLEWHAYFRQVQEAVEAIITEDPDHRSPFLQRSPLRNMRRAFQKASSLLDHFNGVMKPEEVSAFQVAVQQMSILAAVQDPAGATEAEAPTLF